MALRLSTGLRNTMLADASLQDAMANGVLYIYSGPQPTDPDAAASGTLLLKVTVGSGAFAHGTATNGLNLGTPAAGVISKATGEVWSGVAVATGTAGYYRFCANGTDSEPSDADTTRKSIDGAISTSGAQLNMSSTAITTGATTTIDSFSLALPAS
uniref:Uncharacterized protein n=1 Tax=Desulfovibrio sp. U5L TaxID=596152 RepID=I2Q024_9BACT